MDKMQQSPPKRKDAMIPSCWKRCNILLFGEKM
jgi:hypothetical protein